MEHAVAATRNLFVEVERQAEEAKRRAAEAEDAEWRARFKPHAVIQTELTVPSQITMCGLTGGAGRWLMIGLDLSKLPITYISQAIEALPNKVREGRDRRKYVTFFGEALGIIINYSPEKALRCDLDGQPLEVLEKAYRPGDVALSIGGRPVSPTVMSRVLGMA